MFRTMSFEKYIESATSHLHLETDWPTIILICDAIRQNDVSPKNAVALIKKKMFSSNPHTAIYALTVLESVVKNCGAPIHDEISSKTNCEMYTSLVNQTTHENVRNKMLELIQCWAYAFRSTPKYRAIKDTMNILKTEGRTFPELKEADAMFTSDTAPDWVDGEVCDRCRVAFSFTQRKHHCRNCGQVFCGQCSAKTSTLPKYGIEKEVRVCDGCFEVLQKPSSANSTPAKTASDSLPAIYLSSTLAQQSQTPARKTEEELKEEEEFQLALALSQSEAEEAENNKKKHSSSTRSHYTPQQRATSPPAVAPPAAAEETDPELARYLNRNYWEQQQKQQGMESPASPSAPLITPVGQQLPGMLGQLKVTEEEAEITDFSQTMRSQVEIFVNRMKSNSSRGRNIANDSSVQTMFMNLTSHHANLLTYIKAMDEKRMWYEQLQDKLAQVKDSRAALDVLRQEHQERLRRLAEEGERQRQLQMAQKLEMMRKKKHEYLQYQRQMAVHRIQEQERAYHQGYHPGQQQQQGIGGGFVGGNAGGAVGPQQQQHLHFMPQMQVASGFHTTGGYGQQQQHHMAGGAAMPQQQQQHQMGNINNNNNNSPGFHHQGGGLIGAMPMGGPQQQQQQQQQFPGHGMGIPHGAGQMPGHPQMMPGMGHQQQPQQQHHLGMQSVGMHPGQGHGMEGNVVHGVQMGMAPPGQQGQQPPLMGSGRENVSGIHPHPQQQLQQQQQQQPPVAIAAPHQVQQQQPQPPVTVPESAPAAPVPVAAAAPEPAKKESELPMAELISFD